MKYWICLARIEPLTSPIENIIAIYESAILAGAQVRRKLPGLCYYNGIIQNHSETHPDITW